MQPLPRRIRPRDLSLVPFIVAAILIALPVITIGPERVFALTLPTALSWLTILYAVARLTAYGMKREATPITMTFWIFVYIFFGFTPLLQIVVSLAGSYPEGQLVEAYIVVLLGCLAFDIGATVNRRRFRGRRMTLPRWPISRQRTIILAVVSVLATPFLISAYGGLNTLFLSRDERFQALLEASGGGESKVLSQTILALITTPLIIAFLGLLALYRRERRAEGARRKRIDLVALIAVGLAAVVVNNPISTARWKVGTMVLSVVFFLAPWQKRATYSVVTLGVVLLFIVVFPFADTFRVTAEADLGARFQETTIESAIVETGNYDAFEQLVNVVAYVDREGLGYGRQLLGTALFWFPRSVWPNKPLPSGPLIAEWRGSQNTNLSLPLWGEFYLDGHVALVALGMLLFGMLIGRLERTPLETTEASFTTLFIPTFAAFQFFLLRGSLLGSMSDLVPFLLCIWFCTQRRGGKHRPSSPLA